MSVIVNYSKCKDYQKKYSDALNNFDKQIKSYLKYIDNVCEYAIISGKVHDELKIFRQELNRISEMPNVVKNNVTKVIDKYLDGLDNAQKINGVSILYDKTYPGYRDYSSDYFRTLIKMSETVDYDSSLFGRIFDFLEDIYFGVRKMLKLDDNSKKQNIKKTHNAVLQYNDVTRNQVKNIQRQINKIDEECAGYLKLVNDFIWKMSCYIEVFRDVMSKYSECPKYFDVSFVDFESKYFTMMESYNNVLNIETYTDADVDNFIDTVVPEDFMNEQIKIIYDYLAKLSEIEQWSLDYLKLSFFQMFNITEGEIATDGEYNHKLMKIELTEMLDDLSSNYVYSDSDEKAALDTVSSFLSKAKKSGKTLYEYLNSHRDKNNKLILDGRTKKAKRFLRFLDSLQKAKYIIDYGSKSIEVLSKLFVSYDKNLSFLDSFKKNANLSDDMTKCFKELRDLYEHNLELTLIDTIKKEGVEALYSLSIGKNINTIKKAIGIIGDLTGENQRTIAQYELLCYGHDFVDASKSAFIESIRKLKNADKNSKNYDSLVNDFKNCFSIYKNSLKRLFEKMAIAANGSQRDYFYYCASEVSNMSLKNSSNFSFMSYEEYLRDGYAY